MKLTVIGSGDAFGSGGRLQTCYHVSTANSEFLIDCGATAVMGFNRFGRNPNQVSTIYISHLHGDHFAGLVWWLLHARHVAGRSASLTIVGPEGIQERYNTAAEALFPGATSRTPQYELAWLEFSPGVPITLNGVTAIPHVVRHPSGAPSYGIRFEADGKTIGFSGDTEWVDELVAVAEGADLYISECYGFDKEAPFHMSWQRIKQNIEKLQARRIMLTHMSEAMLAKAGTLKHQRVLIAEDGLELEI
ncbi:MAG: MBL fold metallo-hydrolase [Hyphomicrobiaceae bacterium]